MDPKNNNGRAPQNTDSDNTYLPDQTPRREGGDNSLAESSPYSSRSDEKVIVNEQRENKTGNSPLQKVSNTSEVSGSDEEVKYDEF